MTERALIIQPVTPQPIANFADQSSLIDSFRNFFEGYLRCANTRRAYVRAPGHGDHLFRLKVTAHSNRR
jgi:hypothetical protein